jgi:hypothetical protein
MDFTRFDLGEVVRKERGPRAPKSLQLVVGNPLIMKQMSSAYHMRGRMRR